MTDERLERAMGRLLGWGVALSAAVVLGGGAWYLAVNGRAVPDLHAYRRPVQVIRGLRGPEAVMLAGLLLLIATPIARVVFALIAFALEGDRTFVAISLAVLAVLAVSLLT